MAVEDQSGNDGKRLLHERVAEALRRDICTACRYPRGTHLPSEAALCARFKVSRTTVRRALAVLADENLIKAHPGVGHQVRGQIVSRRETGSDLVAVLAPYAGGEPFFADFVGHLERSLARSGLHLAVCSSGDGPNEIGPEHIQRILRMQPRAVVICQRYPSSHTGPLASLRSAGIRVVEFGRQAADFRADFIGTDDRLASLMMAGWLLRWSGGNLATVGSPAPLGGLETRLEGLRLATSLHEVTEVQTLHLRRSEQATSKAGREPSQLSPDRRWGVFCPWLDDLEAAAEAIEDAGLELGKSAALGCVGAPPWAQIPVDVPLAVAAWSAADLGEGAARLAICGGAPAQVLVAPSVRFDTIYGETGVDGREVRDSAAIGARAETRLPPSI